MPRRLSQTAFFFAGLGESGARKNETSQEKDTCRLQGTTLAFAFSTPHRIAMAGAAGFVGGAAAGHALRQQAPNK